MLRCSRFVCALWILLVACAASAENLVLDLGPPEPFAAGAR